VSGSVVQRQFVQDTYLPCCITLDTPPPPGSALLVPFLICPALAAVVSVGVVQRQFVQDTYLPCCITLDTPPPPPTLLVHFLICPAAVLSVGDVQWQLTQGTHTMRSTSDSGEPTFIFSSVLDRDPDTFYCVILKRGRCCQLPGLSVCVWGGGCAAGQWRSCRQSTHPPPHTHTPPTFSSVADRESDPRGNNETEAKELCRVKEGGSNVGPGRRG
jgi:hypothetical protein